jgi:N-acetylmuramoyl-L-alanine amidase
MMKFEKLKRKVHTVFIHCSASDNPKHDNVETIKKWHLERGFSDTGYHFFIDKYGNIHKGRDLEKAPAAQKGYNSGTIAICVSGLKDFSASSLIALRALCMSINEAYENDIIFKGHCEVSNKTCPVFDYKVVLGLDENSKMQYATLRIKPISKIVFKPRQKKLSWLNKLVNWFK